MPEALISFSWATLARKYPLSVRSIATMDSATRCRTPAAVSAGRRLRPEVSKNSSTALSSNDGELVRSITTCAPAMASLSPSPVMLLTPLLGEAATTSWPRWCRMATVFEPIRPVPPMTTIFMVYSPSSTAAATVFIDGAAVIHFSRGIFSILRTLREGPLLVAAPRSSPQHLEYDGGRPTKHEHAVHWSFWPKQSPALHRRYVTIAERGVVHESEIYRISTGGCSTDDRVGQ